MSRNIPLTEFESQTTDGTTSVQEDHDQSEPEQLNAENYSVDNVRLPEKVEWRGRTRIHHDVAAVIGSDEAIEYSVEAKSTNYSILPNQVGYVIEGTDALKQVSDSTDNISLPNTYSEFSEFNEYFAYPTTTFSSGRHGGWGVTAEQLEAALRFVTGGGRYNTSNITVTGLDKRIGWLIEYQGESYIFAYDKVGQPPETLITHDVNGITVENEADSQVLEALEQMMELLTKVGINITGFKERRNNSLYFETDQEKPISFSGSQIKRLLNPCTDLTELEGTHEIDLFHQEESYDYTWEENATKYTPGEVIEESNSESKRILVGYTRHHNQIQKGLRPDKYTVGQRVLAEPCFVQIRPDTYDNRIDTQIDRSNTKEIIAEVPYDVPDHPEPEQLDSVTLWDPDTDQF